MPEENNSDLNLKRNKGEHYTAKRRADSNRQE